jgi:hypothetical protein
MLLRKYRDSKTSTLGNASVLTLFMEQSRLFDFLRGFMTGISGVLLGLALVFNVAGLASKRNERSNNR